MPFPHLPSSSSIPFQLLCGSDSWNFGSLLVPCCPFAKQANTLRPCLPTTRPVISHTCIDCLIRAANAHTDSTFFPTPYQSHRLNKPKPVPIPTISNHFLPTPPQPPLLITCHNLPQDTNTSLPSNIYKVHESWTPNFQHRSPALLPPKPRTTSRSRHCPAAQPRQGQEPGTARRHKQRPKQRDAARQHGAKVRLLRVVSLKQRRGARSL